MEWKKIYFHVYYISPHELRLPTENPCNVRILILSALSTLLSSPPTDFGNIIASEYLLVFLKKCSFRMSQSGQPLKKINTY